MDQRTRSGVALGLAAALSALNACSSGSSETGASASQAAEAAGNAGSGGAASPGGRAGASGMAAVGAGSGGVTGGAGGLTGGAGGVTGGAGGEGGGSAPGGASGAGGSSPSGGVGGGTVAGGAAGASGGAGASAGGAAGSGAGGVPANISCEPIGAGLASLTVDGKKRVFSVQLPKDTSKMALLFLWHGWNQLPGDFTNGVVYDVPSGKWRSFDPDAFPMPLMIVTPWSTKLLPPVGLDWDIASGALDFPYFEAMMACVQSQFTIDASRVYSLGFSAGAVFTNLLSARYPHRFAATISESGMWLNDDTQKSDIQFGFIVNWQWPKLDPADGGNVLLTHGGPGDYATVANLESANAKAVPFLHAGKRTVVACAHNFGHTLDPDLTQAMYYDYLWAHTLGGPPLSGLPGGFPTQTKPVGATRCDFLPP